MRACIFVASILLSQTFAANYAGGQTLRFAPDEYVLGTRQKIERTFYYRDGRETRQLFDATVFIYTPNNGYSLRFYGCHFRLRPLQEHAVTYEGVNYSGSQFKLEDAVNASGKVAENCSGYGDAAVVFIGKAPRSNQAFFVYEQKSQYRAGEVFREHVYLHDRLRPLLGKDIYRPPQKDDSNFSPGQWALALLLLGALAHDVFCEKEQVGAAVRCRK